MLSSVTAGQYLAVPFVFSLKRSTVNEALLAGCAHLPNLFPLPTSELERKAAVAAWLTDPNNFFFEVWHGQTLVGVMGLTRVTVGLDALAHLAFFDRQLLGRRQLVLTMMHWAFQELGLRRLSVEIPEHLDPLIRFCRAKLGFRFEGETLAHDHPGVQLLQNHGINGPGRWVAKFGARRENCYWNETDWKDLICLRLLREEFDGP